MIDHDCCNPQTATEECEVTDPHGDVISLLLVLDQSEGSGLGHE